MGHYECRSSDETLPGFTGLPALEIGERKEEEAVLMQPYTKWCLFRIGVLNSVNEASAHD